MARSERKRVAVAVVIALAVPALVACNGIIGLSDFEKGECAGRRCGDAGIPPVNEGGPDVISDAPPEVRGAAPVSWAQWPMPNSDGGGDFLPNPMKYIVVDADRVEDVVTGLVWRRATLSAQLSLDDAKSACAALDNAAGWRLPKRIELVTLLDFARPSFLVDPVFTGVKNVRVWSSSESRTLVDKAVVVTDAFWTVDFGTGVVDVLSASGGAVASVLCVKAK